MRILFFFFSLLLAMLLCLSAIACKLFVVHAKDVPPPVEPQIVTMHAEMQPLTMTNLPLSAISTEETASAEMKVHCLTKAENTVLPTLLLESLERCEAGTSTSQLSDKAYFVTVTVGGEEVYLSLHDYLIGVLLAELPMGFCEDAQYAQAVAARSYVVHYVERGMSLGPTSCAYLTEECAKKRYSHLYEEALKRATEAVEATDGILLTYDGRVCMAAFHAMSYEKTESAEVVWGEDMPYLVPVQTPEDIELGGMQTEYTFTQEEISSALGGACVLPMTFLVSEGGRVESVTFASGDTYSGTKVRSMLCLRSTAFSLVEQSKNSVTLSVVGYGHGVGMSQWGAQMLALEGYSWQEILLHYYTGAGFDTLASRLQE